MSDMVVATPHHVFSYEEYLERERVTGLKHEFLEGNMFAMAGGTPEHVRLIAAALDAHAFIAGINHGGA